MLLVSRRTSQDAYAGSTVNFMSRAVQHARAASTVRNFFSHLPASWNACDPLPQNVWQSLPFSVYLRPCVQALSSALGLFDQTYPLILIFNERRKSASRLPLAEHVTSPNNLYACNCIRQPRNTPFRCLQFNPS